MKKFLTTVLTAILIALTSVSVQARDKYTHDASVLPPAATVMLNKNFKAKVSLVKTEHKFGKVSEYEVILNNGTEVTFDASGNWKEIETSNTSKVPDSMVPEAIKAYVKSHQNKSKIVGIEKDRKGYEVTLSNGVEMEFDLSGRFIRYDH